MKKYGRDFVFIFKMTFYKSVVIVLALRIIELWTVKLQYPAFASDVEPEGVVEECE